MEEKIEKSLDAMLAWSKVFIGVAVAVIAGCATAMLASEIDDTKTVLKAIRFALFSLGWAAVLGLFVACCKRFRLLPWVYYVAFLLALLQLSGLVTAAWTVYQWLDKPVPVAAAVERQRPLPFSEHRPRIKVDPNQSPGIRFRVNEELERQAIEEKQRRDRERESQ